MCSGTCRKPTVHRFVLNRRAGEMGSYEQIYGCTCCHTERRYGLLG